MKLDADSAAYAAARGAQCAAVTFVPAQKIRYGVIALLFLGLLLYRWDYCVFALSIILMFWYLAALAVRCCAATAALLNRRGEEVSAGELAALRDEDLPRYTILLPMYRESAVADKLMNAVGALDYPREKLEVLILLECDDAETRSALSEMRLPAHFHVLTAPSGDPRTKPRACNCGLGRATGEFCVIYDAEDRPDPDQLKKAVVMFRRDPAGEVACVQAKLDYFNAMDNWLTRFFTVEYATHFELTLGGLSQLNLPVPLGGTSNHFRTAVLQELGGWDPFNVTEDCDLGLRIYEAGYRTRVLDSTTFEEANSKLGNWLRQRSRWVKGFLQTHLVHFRHPGGAVRRLGCKGAFGALLTVGAGAAMMLGNLIFWPLIALYLLLLWHGAAHGAGFVEQIVGPHAAGQVYQGVNIGFCSLRAWPLVYSGADESVFWAGFSQVLFAGSLLLFSANFWFVALGAAACLRKKYYRLIPASLLMPFYWMLISLGAWKGFFQLFTRPFYWEKTRHGLTEAQSKARNTCAGSPSSNS